MQLLSRQKSKSTQNMKAYRRVLWQFKLCYETLLKNGTKDYLRGEQKL